MNRKCVFAVYVAWITALSFFAQGDLVSSGISDDIKREPPFFDYEYKGAIRANQYYSVFFDGKGEADVAVKLTFKNTGEEPIKALVIEIPSAQTRIINAVQEELIRENVSDGSGHHYYYRTIYTSLKARTEELSGSARYEIRLHSSVGEQQTGAVILLYKAKGFAWKSLGVFYFYFETIKMGYDIDNVRVAVNVQEGLHIKDGLAGTGYRAGFDEASSFDGSASENAELRRFSMRIESQRGYVKRTRSLGPWESFNVKGSYSKSWLRLHIWKFFLISAMIAGVISAIVIGAITLAKKRKNAIIVSIVTGALSGTGMTVFVFIAVLIMENSHRLFGYGNEILALLTLLAVFAFFLALLVIPQIFVGRRHGVAFGILTTIIMIAVLAVAVTLLALFYLQPRSTI